MAGIEEGTRMLRAVDAIERYDEENFRPDTHATVEFVAALGADGSLLEFGAGTGRLVRPLARHFNRVIGVDLSADMLARAKEAELPPNVDLFEGDMRTWNYDERFDVVLCVFNTILEIPTQRGQIQAIKNASTKVRKGGYFVVEATHPPLASMAAGKRVIPIAKQGFDLGLVVQMIDWKSQTVDQRILLVKESVVRVRRLRLRMLYPSELDVMAALGGLELHQRLASWSGRGWRVDPASSEESNVISVYRKPQ